MNSRYTLIVAVAAIALIAVAMFAYVRKVEPVDLSKGMPTPTPGPILTLAAPDVQELDVSGPASKKYVLKRVAGGWEVDGEKASDLVDSTVTNLVKLAAVQQLAADRKAADYGFNTPALTVTLKTAAGVATAFKMGDNVVGEPTYAYFRLDGEGKPILVVTNADLKTLTDWLDNKPLAPTPTPTVSGTPGTPGAALPEGTPGLEPAAPGLPPAAATVPGAVTIEPVVATATPAS
jgi:hypothetical protein